MIKLLLCLLASLATAACLMQLRQQRLELNHQTSLLHNQIESRQARLWNQQLQIAKVTAPPALHDTIGKDQLHLKQLAPIGTAPTAWINSATH
jgi:cell division protein FtsL